MPEDQNLLETSLLPDANRESIEVPEPASPEQAPAAPEIGVESPEQAPERAPESLELPVEQETAAVQESAAEAPTRAPAAPPVAPAPKHPDLEEVEQLLAEDLVDIYVRLPDDKKPLFKQKGEQIAIVVIKMVETGRFNAKKILNLIRDWLRMIPGVNKFFLEQEAKIKTDKVGDYIDAKRKERAGAL